MDNRTQILLLGPGSSGKSTFQKQTKIISNKKFDKSAQDLYISILRSDLYHTASTIIDLCQSQNIALDSDAVKCINSMGLFEEPSIKVLKACKKIVEYAINNKDLLRRIYVQQHIHEGLLKLIPRIDEFLKDDYCATDEDILCARVKTRGIVEMEFMIGDRKVKLFDVGGERNDRKKWIHCFEGVDIIFYVAALNDYCKTLVMENVNGLKESLNLFEMLTQSKYLEKTQFVLLLTKADVFDDFLHEFPIMQYFPDYKGSKTFTDVAKWIYNQFKKLCPRDFSAYVLNTMDKNQVSKFYDDMKILMNDLSGQSTDAFKSYKRLHFLHKSKFAWLERIQSNLITAVEDCVLHDVQFVYQ